jgi:heme A synthase
MESQYVEQTPVDKSNPQPIVQQQQQKPAQHDSSESTALCLMITGIFIPLISLINICCHIGSLNPKTKRYALISVAFTIIQAVVGIIIYFTNTKH